MTSKTNLCSGRKLSYDRPCGLLKAVKHQSERAGAITQVEQFLKEEQAMRPTMGLRRRRHRDAFLGGLPSRDDPCEIARSYVETPLLDLLRLRCCSSSQRCGQILMRPRGNQRWEV
jgi:hypothetical protein